MSELKKLRRKVYGALKDWADNGKDECLLVTGARQIGKTFIIEQFIEETSTSHISLNFESNPSLGSMFEGNPSVDQIVSRIMDQHPNFEPIPNDTILFFDEIQACPDARNSIKKFVTDGRYRVISASSLTWSLHSKKAKDPREYERVIEMRSLDFEEFLWAMDISECIISTIRKNIHDKTPIDKFIMKKIDDYFALFMAIGGMPRVINEYLVTSRIDRVIDEKKKIIARDKLDIKRYSPPTETEKILKILDIVPTFLSQENKKFIFSRLMEDNGSTTLPSNDMFAKAIQWLIDSGIIMKCRQVDNSRLPDEIFTTGRSFKTYMDDTGLLLATMSDDVTTSILDGDLCVKNGGVTENAIAECLSKSGHELYYFRNSNMDVDFIIEMDGDVVALGVKPESNNRSKSLNSMKVNHGLKRCIKFERANIHASMNGVEIYPLFAAAFIDSMYD